MQPTRAQWARLLLALGLALALHHPLTCESLEIVETKVDRDGDVLLIEDLLEGFGSIPVSVEFSPISNHMFMAFKAGEVRIYPDGADTEAAAVFVSCVDIEDEVRAELTILAGLSRFLLSRTSRNLE